MSVNTYIRNLEKEIRLSQLTQEINDNINIIPSCVGITQNNDEYRFDFLAELTEQEEISLDNIIDNHIPTEELIPVSILPISKLDGVKIAVHNSTKPIVSGSTSYIVWTGSGDDLSENVINDLGNSIGNGDLLQFNLTPEVSEQFIDVEFNPNLGKVWINEGYLKFNNGGNGDHMCAYVIANAVPLQEVENLDLIVDNNWIKYSTGGPGTGTHGFADTSKISLLERTFSKDGDWDYINQNLTPNFTGTGQYKMPTIDRTVHRFINKIPTFGSCNAYFSMNSDETILLPTNYKIRIVAFNNSLTTWDANVILEIYREVTSIP